MSDFFLAYNDVTKIKISLFSSLLLIYHILAITLINKSNIRKKSDKYIIDVLK